MSLMVTVADGTKWLTHRGAAGRGGTLTKQGGNASVQVHAACMPARIRAQISNATKGGNPIGISRFCVESSGSSPTDESRWRSHFRKKLEREKRKDLTAPVNHNRCALDLSLAPRRPPSLTTGNCSTKSVHPFPNSWTCSKESYNVLRLVRGVSES